MESQMTRPYGYNNQEEDPIRIHHPACHPDEEEHQETGATKVLKKVKEKAKKIKNSITKHGHGHEHDHDVEEEDDEYDEQDPEVHGAPVYESSAVRGGVTGQPESISHPGNTDIPAPEEIIPPGTKVFPVVTSDYTRPVEPEPLRDTTYYGHEAATRPFKISDLSDRDESREAHQEPLNTPVSLLSGTEDVTRTFAPGEDEHLGGQRKVNMERPKGLEEDPAGPGGGSDYLSGVSNYQSKVTDPTHEGGGESGVPGIAESLGRMKVTDEEKLSQGFDSTTSSRGVDLKNEYGTDKTSRAALGGGSIAGLGESHDLGVKKESGVGDDSLTGYGGESGDAFPTRSHETEPKGSTGVDKDSLMGSQGYGDVKVSTVSDLPTGTHDQFSPELSRPEERDDIAEEMKEETQGTKPNSYTGKIASATSAITDKAIAAKNVVASKLGYSGQTTGATGQHDTPVAVEDETSRSATGYGQKVVGTVADKLAPVYEKVKETGSTVMTKLPLSGGGSQVEETHQREGKGVSARDYLAEKLTPGEEEKALSEVIAEKLHLGGGEKMMTTTKEVEVTVEKIPTDQIPKEMEHIEEGKGGGGGMVGKIKGWLGGATDEIKPKSLDSSEESSQSIGSTVGTMGFTDSGGPVERGFQKPGN